MAATTRRPRYRFAQLLPACKAGLIARIGLAPVLIWAVTFAPLVDGVFFSTAASGQLSLATTDGFWHALVFGAACFSGGGAVAGALTLPGSRRRRFLTLLGIYFTIGLGILAELAVLTWTPWQLPADLPVVGAFVLLALATVMLGWQLPFHPLTMLVILVAFLAALALHAEPAANRMAFAAGSVLAASLLALTVGFLVTLAAALLSTWLTHWLDPVWITRAGAVSVAAIALSELGVPIPAALTLGILAAGAILPPVIRSLR